MEILIGRSEPWLRSDLSDKNLVFACRIQHIRCDIFLPNFREGRGVFDGGHGLLMHKFSSRRSNGGSNCVSRDFTRLCRRASN